MGVPERIHRLMRRQHSLVTRSQALAGGMTAAQIRHELTSGAWLLLRPGVYGSAAAVPTFEQSALAVVLACGHPAAACGGTAVRLWGLDGSEPDALEVLTPPTRRVRLDGVRAHRSLALFDDDLTRVRGVPATTVERTLVDCSGALTPSGLGRLVDAALRRRILRLDRLARCLGRLGAASGRRPSVVHEVLGARLPGYDPGDSDLETRVLRLLLAAGFPVPRQQYRVRLHGRTYRIDLAWPDQRIAIELDGFLDHGTLRSTFDADRLRANELVLDDWLLLRFTSAHPDARILDMVAAAHAVACGRLAS